MSGKPLELPAYISLKYAEGNVFSQLQSDVANVTGVVRRDFEDLGASAKKALQQAMSGGSGGFGGIDIGVGQFRELARAQQASAIAADQVAMAARRVADAEGGGSIAARQAADAFAALAAKEQQAATAALAHADVMQKVQAELTSTSAAASSVIASNARLSAAANDNAAAQNRAAFGMRNLGQQVGDFATQVSMGGGVVQAFSAQLGQTGYALSEMGGAAGRVGAFLTGPWGIALTVGALVAAPLVSRLFEIGDAADKGTGKLDAMTAAIARLSQAQGRATAADLGYAQADFFEKQVKTRAARELFEKSGSSLAGAQVRPKLREKLIESQNELRQSSAILEASKMRFDVSNRAKASDAAADQAKKDSSAATKAQNAADRAAKAEGRQRATTNKFGNDAAETIRRANEQWDAAPTLIDKAARSTRELDALIAELGKRKPINWQATAAEAETAKAAIEDALVRPVEDMRRESQQRLAVQELLSQGRDDEAAALQGIQALEATLGSEELLRSKVAELTAAGRKDEAAALQTLIDKYPDLKAQIREATIADQQRTRELQRQQALFEAQLDVLNTTKRDLTSILSGRKADLFGNLKQGLADLQGVRLSDKLFGGMFETIEAEFRNRSPLGKATTGLVTGVDTARTAITGHADTTAEAMRVIREAIDSFDGGAGQPFDDGHGNGEIVVAGRHTATSKPSTDVVAIQPLSIKQIADRMADGIVDPLLAGMGDILGTGFAQQLGGIIKGGISGYAQAGKVGAVIGGAQGIVDNLGLFNGQFGDVSYRLGNAMDGVQKGAQIAGIGKMLGIKTSTTGSQLGGAIGAATGIPGLDIAGSIAGGLLGGLFKKTKKGYSNDIHVGDDGTTTYSTAGNSASRKAAAGGLADSLGESLKNIADQLGGGLNSSLNLGSLGQKKDKFTFDATPGNSAGRQEFASQEEATRAALEYAINQGVVTGIRASTNRILKSGKDLDKALQDALTFENAFEELKSIKDPLGAALDSINSEFTRLTDLATKAGASASEWADLEELYGIRRQEAVDQAEEKLLGSLKGLLDGLTVDNDALSLRSRDAAAIAAYNPLRDRVAAGDTTAYDDFADAAQQLLAIERDLYGSQQGYFDRLDEVTKLTRDRIGAETNVVSIAENRDSPFDSAGKVKDSIVDQTAILSSGIDATNINLGTLIQQNQQLLAALTGGADVRKFAQNTFY